MLLVYDPDIRCEAGKRGQGVGIDAHSREMEFRHVAHRLDDIRPFRLGKPGLPAGECPDGLIRPQQDMQFAQLGGFLEKTKIAGGQLVQTGGNDDLRHGFNHAIRTCTRKEPGTGLLETTVR